MTDAMEFIVMEKSSIEARTRQRAVSRERARPSTAGPAHARNASAAATEPKDRLPMHAREEHDRELTTRSGCFHHAGQAAASDYGVSASARQQQ